MADTSLPRRRRLLIVDDCPDTTDSLAFLAREWGCEVEVANEGASALQLASGRRPDVAFLDLAMPGMDGYELARCLRRLPGLERALLVAVSGYSDEDHRRCAFEAGCNVHLTKPVDPEQLRVLLDNT